MLHEMQLWALIELDIQPLYNEILVPFFFYKKSQVVLNWKVAIYE